jgi:hypothetical protein
LRSVEKRNKRADQDEKKGSEVFRTKKEQTRVLEKSKRCSKKANKSLKNTSGVKNAK